jgi:hypothetical protein
MEVSPLSRVGDIARVVLRSTSIRPVTERHSLFPSSHTRSPVGLPCGSLSLSFDPGLMKMGLARGGLRAYHVSCECQSGLGLASSPVAQRLRRVS